MKKLVLLPILVFLATLSFSQSVGINTDGATPDPSALLDLKSLTKGLLVPRMDSTLRKAIPSPARGLLVYDCNTNSFWYYNGTSWVDWANSGSMIKDSDSDTKIQVEESSNENIIRFDIDGSEKMRLSKNSSGIPILEFQTSTFNTMIGNLAGINTAATVGVEGKYNTFLGNKAGEDNVAGHSNIFLGHLSGTSTISGNENTFLGTHTGRLNKTGNKNTCVGAWSGSEIISGNHNTLFGYGTGGGNLNGNNNTAIGYEAGGTFTDHTKTGNVLLGYRAGFSDTTDNKLYIANSGTNTPLLYGEFDNQLFRINGTLDISGNYSLPTLDGMENQVLTTDGSGSPTWIDIPFKWLDGTNGSVYYNQSVGIGSAEPLAELHIDMNRDTALLIAKNTTNSHDIIGILSSLNNTGGSSQKALQNELNGPAGGDQYGIHTTIPNTGTGQHFAIYNSLSGSGFGAHYALLSQLSGTGKGNQYGNHIEINNSGLGYHYGTYQYLNGSGNGNHFGVYNWLDGGGTGDHIGTKTLLEGAGLGLQVAHQNIINNSGSGNHLGTQTELSGSGSGMQIGLKNEISNTGNGVHYGIYNELTGTGLGDHYSLYASISGNSDGDQYGSAYHIDVVGTKNHYGSYHQLTGGGGGARYGNYHQLAGVGTGTQYGLFQEITNTGGGEHLAIYNEIGGSGIGKQYGLKQLIYNTSNGEHFGNWLHINNNGGGAHYGTYQRLSGTGNGPQYSTYHEIDNTGTNTHYGSYQKLSGAGSGDQYASFQEISNSGNGFHYGTYTLLTGNGNGSHYGSRKEINNSGSGALFGTFNLVKGSNSSSQYGTRNEITSTGNGTHYGTYNTLSGGTGQHVAGYFNAPGGANDYAAIFQAGNVVLNEGGGNYDFRVESDDDNYMFLLDASQNRIGIGIAAPDEMLHLQNNNDASIKVESGLSDNASLMLFEDSDLGFEFQYDGSADELYLWSRNFVGDTGIRMVWEKTGEVGINEINPNGMLHIKQFSSEKGLRIENDNDTDHWSYEIGDNDLNIYFNDTRVGYWDDATGNYTATSDRRLKKDITYLHHPILSKLSHLKPATYRLLHASPESQKAIGFIAQEVQAYFPEVVRTTDEGNLSINYADFSVLAIKGIQEMATTLQKQETQINRLNDQNKTLEKQIQLLAKRLAALEEENK